MEISLQNIYQYLDILIREGKISEPDSSKSILYEKYLMPITDKERYDYHEICDQSVTLGIKLGFMTRVSSEMEWFELTEKGIEAKEYGGYFKYKEAQEKKTSNQNNSTIIAQNYIHGNNHGSQFSKNFDNVIISNNAVKNESEKKPKTFLDKLWNLATENKLVSTLLVAIILYIIKETLNINLK